MSSLRGASALVSFLLIQLLVQSTISQEYRRSNEGEVPQGAASLAFVFDITGSMYDDLVQVIEGAAKILATTLARREKPLYNYVLVPFHDPEIGPITVTTDPGKFQRELRDLYVQGGGDCPEMSIGAVREALKEALPNSFIYVFTDARAKDFLLTEEVLTLIQQKQSQVVFVMTGDCGNTSHPGYQAYEQIAATSSGQIFLLKKSQVNQILVFVKVAVQSRKVNLLNIDSKVGDSIWYELPVDTKLQEFTVSVSGPGASVMIKDPEGKRMTKGNGLNELLSLKKAIIVNVKEPTPGKWRLKMSSTGGHTIRITGISMLDFIHGFSRKPTLNMAKTAVRPIKGVSSYLLLNATDLDPPGRVTKVQVLNLHGDTLLEMPIHHNSGIPSLYNVSSFVPPSEYFFLKVDGIDSKGYAFQRTTPTALNPYEPTPPKITMPKVTRGFYEKTASLNCTVESIVPFNVQWFKDGRAIGNKLFFTESSVAVHLVHEASSQAEGMYTCNATSAAGSSAESTFLDIKDPPPVIVPAHNVSVLPGETAMLSCVAYSTVEYNTTWHRPANDFDPNRFPRARIFSNGSMQIRSVKESDEGPFVCEVQNEGGSTEETVWLIIQRAPVVTAHPKTQGFVVGSSANITCTSRGFPQPTYIWKRNGKILAITARVHYDSRGHLTFHQLTKADAGEYECEATNSAGIGSDTATLSYRVAPKLRKKQTTVLVNNGDTATLVCDATGLPPPTITWYRGGIELTDLSFIQINDKGELVIVGTQDMDAGEYQCVATNDGGSDTGTVILKVGSAPVITAMPSSIGVDILHNASMPCAASGLPPPKITWRRADGQPIDFQYRFTQLRDGTLFINSIQKEDEGMYTCLVENQFGSQEVSAFITVTGIVRPLIAYTNPKVETIVGRTVEMNCHVLLGNPPPKIMWIKDGRLAGEAERATDDGNGNFVITDVQVDDEGEYVCLATNVGGNATYVTKLDVQVPPAIMGEQTDFIAIEGSTIRLPCHVKGDPRPQITWTKNGIRISENDPHYFVNEEGSLDIYSVRAHDTATYSCTAINLAGVKEKRLSLFVQVPPTITQDLDEFTVIINNPVQMPCEARGIPPPTIFWKKAGENITSSDGGAIVLPNGALRINRATVDDAGVYECVASSVAGTASKAVTLRVQVPPKITSEGARQKVVLVGEKVIIGCEHIGYPPPVISWRKDRHNIDFFNLDHKYLLTETGSLLIESASLDDTARYRCRAENPAGVVNRVINLVVHEPPSIPENTPSNMSVIENNRVTLPCPARGTPSPKINWYRKGVLITGNELGVTLLPNGGLQFDNTQGEDTGHYVCKAENVAGKAQHAVSLLVYLPPRFKNKDGKVLPDQTSPEERSEGHGKPVILACPVEAVPPPQITWYKNGHELRPADLNGQLTITNGGRILRIHKSEVEDTAMYECVARNLAGETAKRFNVNVHVKPSVDNDTASNRNLSVILDNPVIINCPINGIPPPKIIWFKDGERIHPQNEINMRLLSNGRRLEISAADITDTGRYKCIGRNSAGEADLEFDLHVLVPAQIDGSDTISEPDVVVNRSITLACPASGIPLPSIAWFKEEARIAVNSSRLIILEDGWRLQLLNAEVKDAGRYYCRATNVAGKSEKYYDLHVLVPPRIQREGVDLNPKVIVNQTIVINCAVFGIPNPRVVWLRNDEILDAVRYPYITVSGDGRQLRLSPARISDAASYRCLAVNKAGEDSLDFNLEVQVPTFIDTTNLDRNPKVIINSNQILECPAMGIPFPEVEWLKNGKPINLDENPRFSLVKMHDGMPLRIRSIQVNDTGHYECRASNEAGMDKIDYNLEVFVPPRIDDDESTGANPQVVINRTTLISCIVYGIPKPRIKWLMNGRPIASLNNPRIKMLADRRQLKIEGADVADTARYTCIASNAAGVADKDFDLDVLVPPYIDDTNLDSKPKVIQGRHIILSCPAMGIPYPNVTWFRGLRPISENARVHILLGGRQLRISASQQQDAGRYTCVAANIAGEARQNFDLQVLVPPSIDEANLVDNPKVVLNRTVILECPVEGNPLPLVRWLINGEPLVPDRRMRLLTGGRQLELANAQVSDTARYTCIATNEAGELTRNFDLDVLVPAHIPEHDKLVKLYVVENRTVYIDCPAEGIPPPSIMWMRDRVPLLDFPYRNIRLLSNGHQLELRNVKIKDEARYTCQATNKAGQAEKSFVVKVQVPPLIVGSGQIEDVSVVVRQSIRLECEATGDPKPKITWFKDGSVIEDDENVRVLRGGRILQISAAKPSDVGGYTCHAMNVAGEDQRRFKLSIHEPPKINGSQLVEELSVTIGQSIVMECAASGSPKPLLWWVREGESLVFNTNPNLRILQGGSKLQVVNSQLMDIGGYTCVASNVAGNASKQFVLSVLVPPTIEDGLTEVAATIHSRTSLPCETLGLPEPQVTWRKDGEPLPANGPRHRMQRSGTLEFSSVKVEDTGAYECVAENEAGTASRTVQLQVLVPPTIEMKGKETRHVVVGDRVNLPCAATGVPKPRIMWQKGTRLLGDTPGYKLMPNGDLQIESAEIRDSGIYICVAQNNAGTDLGQLRLEVQVPPSIENQKTEFVVNQGREVTLPCRANGIPRPKVTWKKDGQPIPPNEFRYRVLKSGWLMIPMTSIEDAGTYQCVAKNKAGKASVDVKLIVHVPPSIEETPGTITKIQGHTAELICKASGVPPPRIAWIKDGHAIIENSGRHNIDEESGRLTIRKVQSEDTGSYVCTAKNQAGRDSKEIVLLVQVAPTFTIIPKDEEVTANGRIKLICAAEGIPTPVITWKVNNTHFPTPPSINGRSRLIIDNAMKKDDGTYMCFAKNPAGVRRALAAVRVKVPPKVRLPPGTHAVSLSQRVLLHCPVEAGDPPPVIHWTKEGRPVELGHRIKQLKNGTLVIYDSTSQDAGEWKCVATNEAGTSEGIAVLTVSSPPVFKNELEDMVVEEGETVIMNCVADGQPKPTIKWRKERLVLTTEGRVTILPNNSLRIVASQMSDGGMYFCFASNYLGSVFLQATLTVQVHGSWSNWESWSPCSESCGHGNQHRSRVCDNPRPKNGGRECYGQSKDSKTCMLKKCGIAGGWGEWNIWEACSASCGSGMKLRRRLCNNPVPKHDGEYCKGNATETLACNVRPCPVNGNWGEWSDWKGCSEICGEGSKERFRRCNAPKPQHGGKHCEGDELQRRPCKIRDCERHGHWGDWSPWTSCSHSCGGGKRTRERKCNDPPPKDGGRDCSGVARQIDYCNKDICPVHGGWSTWSPWSECTATCDGGQRRRHRTCTNPIPQHNGRPCFDSSQDTEKCNQQKCAKDGKWDEWGDWSPCSKTCGGGEEKRFRRCKRPLFGGKNCAGDNSQRRKCNLHPCRARLPRYALGNVIGNINDQEFGIARLTANISRTGHGTQITGRLEDVPANIARHLQNMLSILTPVYWTTATEVGKAVNGYSLTQGLFRREVQVEFATGEVLKMTHIARGLDHDGVLQIDIIVNGYVPVLPSKAKVSVLPYHENYIQTGPGTLYAYSSRIFSLNGHPLPYAWNHTITYDEAYGKMPYLVERLRADELFVDYDENTEHLQYHITASISKGEPSNKCPRGFILDTSGPYCKDDNECSRRNPCSHICHNSIGSFTCSCPTGLFLSSDGHVCKDIDECERGLAKCGRGQECLNTVGSYRCVVKCRRGMRRTSDGLACEDINECKERSGLCEHKCYNLNGGYRCMCRSGYRLVGKANCVDIDECRSKTSLCSHKCRNTEGSYECSCPDGFRLVAAKTVCKDVDECKEGTHTCDRVEQECQNTEGGFTCIDICPKGYHKATNGTCVDIDECHLGETKCQYNQICMNTPGGYRCACPRGFRSDGPNKPCTDIDECQQKNRCQHECHNLVGSYRCSCPEGYRVSANRRTCEDIDECRELSIDCGPEQMCFNRRGDFKCVDTKCPPLYIRDPETGYCALPCSKSDKPCPPGAKYADVLEYRLLALPSGIPAHQDLIRLIAYNQDGVHLPETVFSIVDKAVPPPPFGIKLRRGKGIVFTLQPLEEKNQYRLKVRARSYDRRKHDIQYQTTFIIFISVSMFPY